jgi:hypothetical protein
MLRSVVSDKRFGDHLLAALIQCVGAGLISSIVLTTEHRIDNAGRLRR